MVDAYDFDVGDLIEVTNVDHWPKDLVQGGVIPGVVVSAPGRNYGKDRLAVRMDGYDYHLESAPDNHHPLYIERNGVRHAVSAAEVDAAVASIRESMRRLS